MTVTATRRPAPVLPLRPELAAVAETFTAKPRVAMAGAAVLEDVAAMCLDNDVPAVGAGELRLLAEALVDGGGR